MMLFLSQPQARGPVQARIKGTARQIIADAFARAGGRREPLMGSRLLLTDDEPASGAPSRACATILRRRTGGDAHPSSRRLRSYVEGQ